MNAQLYKGISFPDFIFCDPNPFDIEKEQNTFYVICHIFNFNDLNSQGKVKETNRIFEFVLLTAAGLKEINICHKL